MSKKTLLILFLIFIVLILVASFSWWNKYFNFIKLSSSNNKFNFSFFTEDTTQKFVISKQGEELKTLTKENNKWQINNFDASPKIISDFFKTLNELKVESLISKNPKNYANFGVDENGYVLTFTTKGQDFTFIIGSNGPSFDSFYARQKDETNVYLIKGFLRDKLLLDIAGWRDKTLINLSKDKIQKIEIIRAINPFIIVKTQDGKWQIEGNGKKELLEETTANQLLSAFNPLEASDFLNKKQELEFKNSKEKLIVRVLDIAGNNVDIKFLKHDSNNWWAMVEGREIYYQIPSYKVSDIFLNYEDIFKTRS